MRKETGSEGRADREKQRQVLALGEGGGRAKDAMDEVQTREGVGEDGEGGVGARGGSMREGTGNSGKLSTEDSTGISRPTGVNKVGTGRRSAVEG